MRSLFVPSCRRTRPTRRTRGRAHRRELIDPKIAEHDGRIVKTTGDGLLLEFSSVVDAACCAVEVQRGMAERNAGIGPDKRLDVRIGINVGDIIIDGNDIFGDGVNVAARLEALAEPGGICVSRVVRDQVLDKLSFTFEDLGAQEVKNIARPVEVYRVDLGSAGTQTPTGLDLHWRHVTRALGRPWRAAGILMIALAGIAFWTLSPFSKTGAAPTPPPLSMAILPFATPAGGAAEKEFAETLRRDLITGLAAVRRDLKTVQSDALVNGAPNSRELGQRLNVRYVVEGDVRRGATSNTVNLRLISVESGAQLWGEQYDLADCAIDVASAVKCRKIVGQLGSSVEEAETHRIIALPLDRLSAAELVLRGYAVLTESQTHASVKEARRLFDAALRLDPNLVSALVARSIILDAEKDVDPNAGRDRTCVKWKNFQAGRSSSTPATLKAGGRGASRWPLVVIGTRH